MRRAWVVVAMLLVGCAVSPPSATPSPAPTTGILTGAIRRCTGNPDPGQGMSAPQAGTVHVYRTGHVARDRTYMPPADATGKPVATQTVTAGASYRFVLAPGNYVVVSDTGGPYPIDWGAATVVAGQTVTVDAAFYGCI